MLEAGDVSRHHARFEHTGDELRIVDLGSTNGTRLNGRPVGRERLRPGDEVSFGSVRVQVLPFDPDAGERSGR